MSSVVATCVTRALCKNQGCLEFKQLDQIIRQSVTVPSELFLGVLLDIAKFIVIEGEEKRTPDLILNPDSLIIAKTSLRVCQNLSSDNCDNCEDLQLCRYYVCGNCRFGTKCKHPHNLNSAHNSAILKKTGLQELDQAELFQLLLQNDSYLLPEVCSHYNKGNGEHGSCKFKTACTHLHVCLHFLQGNCKFGAACKRAHTFDASSMKILNGRGFSPENIRIFHKIYKNKFMITDCKEKPVLKKTEKEKCVRVHCNLPYKWQVLDRDGVTWRDLPNGEDIEKAYCNPASNKSAGTQSVNFFTMTCGASPVHRLSTASSVTKPPHFILTTEWLWYWRDDQGGWTEFGHQDDPKRVASITSQTLENVYLTDINSEIPFSSAGQKYMVYLKDMHQQNIKYKTKREIRRRPRFVSAEDVEGKFKSESPESSSSFTVDVPAHWDKGALPNFTYKLVPLTSSAAEFKRVDKLFKRTMPTSTIRSIRRMQNPSLWRVFQWQKEQMMERNAKFVDQRHLFHGTEQSLMEAICEQNFDWRICGIHGSHYGKGSYFARDAAYSDRYATSKSSTKIMFVALVLIGAFTKGNSSYLRPPPKGKNKGFYDSCVDSESNPSIFVIFEKYQIYPEFIIEYS